MITKLDRNKSDGKNRIWLRWKQRQDGKKYLVSDALQGRLDEQELEIVLTDDSERTVSRFPVFQQKAGTYGCYSEYMTRHGCACCSLTTLLAAFAETYRTLRPEETIAVVEKSCFGEMIWKKNYSRPMALQMPVSLYGISRILTECKVTHQYVGHFVDETALLQIHAHLQTGRPVVVETSRMKRKNGRIVKWFDKRFAGSYHTMILLGEDEEGQVFFTDSATRAWSGQWQRLKKAALPELLSYMFPQKNTDDTHVYFSKRKNTGGYILMG